jgi:chaperone LolA
MKSIRWILSFIFICSTLLSQNKISAEEVVANVQQKYSSFLDVSAKFSQRSMLRFGKKEQLQNGIVKIKKKNRFRIESDQQIISTDGKTVWMYTTFNNQVIISPYKKNSASLSADQFLQGLPKDFEPEIESASKTEYTLVLTPKKKTNFISTFRAVINNSDWTIQKIGYIDANKTTTAIELSEMKVNSGIADSDFVFQIPLGAAVVDSRNFIK